jgi:hypothetical protein
MRWTAYRWLLESSIPPSRLRRLINFGVLLRAVTGYGRLRYVKLWAAHATLSRRLVVWGDMWMGWYGWGMYGRKMQE